jgi:hypothetical protein
VTERPRVRARALALRAALVALHVVAFARGEERTRVERYRPREPNYLWPTLEMGAILACGAGWYVLDRKTNQADWDDPPLLARFDGDAWRLDTNRFGINFVGHPLTGALSYGVARGHDLGPGEAFAFSLGTSLAWELGVEFREKVSLNDVLVTAPAGVPVGEAAYRVAVEIAARVSPEEPLPEDARGRYVGGLVALAGGVPLAATGEASTFGRLDAAGSLVWLPGYRGEGALERAFWRGEHLTYRTQLGASASGGLFDGDATLMLAGFASQASGGADGRRHALVLGLPLGFRYRAASLLGFRELLAMTRFPGVGFELHGEAGGIAFGVSGEGAFHLSGASAPSGAPWPALAPGQVGKSVLRREGYFYGVGPALALRGEVGWGPLAIEASLGWVRLRSLDGLDRAQEELTVDEVLVGDRLEASARVFVAVPTTAWRVFAGGEGVRWRSRVDAARAEVASQVATAGIALAY